MLATVTPGVQWRCHAVRGPWCYRKSWKAAADPFSFRCTQHVGPIMPWVLAWATWHHSAQPLCNSTFSSDIQGNKKRISGRREGGEKRRGGIRVWEAGEAEARPGQSAPESSLWYTLIWPPTICDLCIPRMSSVLRDKPTLPSLTYAGLMSARGHKVND